MRPGRCGTAPARGRTGKGTGPEIRVGYIGAVHTAVAEQVMGVIQARCESRWYVPDAGLRSCKNAAYLGARLVCLHFSSMAHLTASSCWRGRPSVMNALKPHAASNAPPLVGAAV